MALEVGTSTTEEFAFTVITAMCDTVSGVLTHSTSRSSQSSTEHINYATCVMYNYATVA